MRLTHQQLLDYRVSEDWSTLWIESIPWVRLAATSLRTNSVEDLLQEGYLAAGRAVREWNPDLSPFWGHIYAYTRNRMLNYLRAQGRRTGTPLESADSDVEGPEATYGDMGHVPQGYGDAAQELARIAAPGAAEALLRRLDPATAMRLRERWGLPAFDSEGGEETSVPEMAHAQGVPRESLRDSLVKAQKSLAREQSRGEYRSTGAVYAPPGRRPLPAYVPVEDRYPGFWSGLAGAMGDVSAWRESVGTVWNDWSWKPQYSDIRNGCKP